MWDWQDFETKSHGLFIFGSLYITEGYSILWFSMAKINVWGLLLLRALYMLPNYVFASNHSGEITEISLRHFCQKLLESIGSTKWITIELSWQNIFFVWKTQLGKVVKTQCGNYRNSLSHFFDKNFMKVTFLLKKLLES